MKKTIIFILCVVIVILSIFGTKYINYREQQSKIKKENLEYRKFIIKNYVIIYQINLKSREVNILHIYNQKQYK